MKFTGESLLHGSPEQVWAALLDPAVLVRTIPGCERLVGTGEHVYDMTVTAGVAAVRGTYSGTCRLHALQPHTSLVMDLRGAGASGTVGATVDVRFGPAEGGTLVSYDADAVVGGMIGGVGQRMLSSVSKRLAGEFFGNVDDVLTGAATAVPAPAVPATDGSGALVFTAPPSPAAGQTDFLRGVAVGAGLVALGVVLGGLAGRRL